MTDEVLAVKVSSHGKLLAISLLNNNVQVVYLDTLKLFLTLYGHKLPVLSIDISSDSKLIITSSADKNIKIWGLDFGDCHKSIFGHQDSIMNVKFIGDSHNFFSSGKDGLIKYWDGDKFECIQKLVAHQSEVWSLSVSHSGLFMVSASHDHSLRLWSATNDQVFLEEEREKEIDELYEDTLLTSLEGEEPVTEEGDDSDEVTKVTKQTMESLKAGEKLIEAIDIGYEDLNNQVQYHQALAQYQKQPHGVKPTKPESHTILMAYGMSGEQHVFKTVTSIRSAQLEDALLVLPFSYTKKLLAFIEVWMQKLNNLNQISVVCKVLNFLVKNNLKELVHQKDSDLKSQLVTIKTHLRQSLEGSSHKINFNLQGMKFVRTQWNLQHQAQYIDQAEQAAAEDSRAIKRSFVTI
ncbi:beta transducin [Yamadazyma tenuis]|nr:beta transducin [Yamadazyma tenuis]